MECAWCVIVTELIESKILYLLLIYKTVGMECVLCAVCGYDITMFS